ncbi:MAG TPA: FG-GAP-like repeat-containing protein, partial [Candidatus Eisenbacteria bacterium]|nr:FG-GAP-like repeat-containing protein [Candidatus Eisenbacteria bacterium]
YDDRTIRFWRGVGDGTFGSASPLPPVAQWGGFVVADADGDGDPDLCAQDAASGQLRIWENDGAGGLTGRVALDVSSPLNRFALADVDADGDQDLVTLGPPPSGLELFRGQGPYQFAAPESYRTGANPGEVSIRDLDFDGRADVVSLDPGGSQLAVHRQRADGSFAALPEVALPGAPTRIVTGDWDGDGATDAAVGVWASPAIHFYVSRSGTLVPLGSAILPAPPTRIRVADMDGDGVVEVVASVESDARIFVIRPAAAPVVETHAWTHQIADFDVVDWNGDRRPDLVVASLSAPFDSTAVLSKSAGGDYVEIARGRGTGNRMACGDFNGDGAVDVALTWPYFSGTVLVFWGNVSGTMGEAFAYYGEEDVFGDLAVTGPDPAGRQGLLAIPRWVDRWAEGVHSLRLYRGGPDFTLPLQGVLGTGEAPTGPVLADLNGDGVRDIVTADGRANTISVLPGYLDGTYGRRQAFGSGGGPAGVAIADMDGDGRPDVLVASGVDQRIAIHRNLGTLRFNHAPAARPGGPYAGIAGSPIAFDGGASADPDGDPLTYRWRFGDGIEGAGVQPLHTFAAGGSYRVVLTVSDGTLENTDSTTAIVTALLAAKVFRAGGGAPVVLGAGPPTTCLYLEPLSADFALEDVDPASLRLVATVAGSTDSVATTATKHGSIGDADRNGIPDMAACFGREALEGLLDGAVGRASIPITLRGRLFNGAIVEGSATILVLARGGGLASFVRPQPVTHAGVIGFRLLDAGFATVRLFDAQGRMVRTILPRTRLAAGYHEVPFEPAAGARLRIPSGVYFYRIESSEGAESGRVLLAR